MLRKIKHEKREVPICPVCDSVLQESMKGFYVCLNCGNGWSKIHIDNVTKTKND